MGGSTRCLRDGPMLSSLSDRTGLFRGDRKARLARMRLLLPPDHAIVGIDLADSKQAAVVTDHDSRVVLCGHGLVRATASCELGTRARRPRVRRRWSHSTTPCHLAQPRRTLAHQRSGRGCSLPASAAPDGVLRARVAVTDCPGEQTVLEAEAEQLIVGAGLRHLQSRPLGDEQFGQRLPDCQIHQRPERGRCSRRRPRCPGRKRMQ